MLDALRNGDYSTAKRLLSENRLNLQVRNKWGYTPLHISNDVEITRLLIRQGADVNAGGAGVDPQTQPLKNLDLGKFGNLDLNELKRGEDYSPLHTVENVHVAAVLIEAGANVNALANYNTTPLHQASSLLDGFELVQLLLKHGANVNARTFYNSTPLHKAMFYSNKDKGQKIIRLLIEHGADVNAQDNMGHSALHQLRGDAVELADYLVQQGADLTLKTVNGDMPICYAIADRKKYLIQFFTEKGKGIPAECSNDRGK
ncbi:MAG: ankyrin repeat domain-containing protein [SAR324 cluster bacterium]|nr:ankyrin repeat domain-containing protein [SAR324 cluster bacterium]